MSSEYKVASVCLCTIAMSDGNIVIEWEGVDEDEADRWQAAEYEPVSKSVSLDRHCIFMT